MNDIKAGFKKKRKGKVLSCEASERMIVNASHNLSRVLIVNRNNLEMTREGSEGKVAHCPCFLSLGQSLFLCLSPYIPLSTKL